MQSVSLKLSKTMIASVHTPCGDRPLPRQRSVTHMCI